MLEIDPRLSNNRHSPLNSFFFLKFISCFDPLLTNKAWSVTRKSRIESNPIIFISDDEIDAIMNRYLCILHYSNWWNTVYWKRKVIFKIDVDRFSMHLSYQWKHCTDVVVSFCFVFFFWNLRMPNGQLFPVLTCILASKSDITLIELFVYLATDTNIYQMNNNNNNKIWKRWSCTDQTTSEWIEIQ